MECPHHGYQTSQHREGAGVVFLGQNLQWLDLGNALLEGHVKVCRQYLAIQNGLQSIFVRNC